MKTRTHSHRATQEQMNPGDRINEIRRAPDIASHEISNGELVVIDLADDHKSPLTVPATARSKGVSLQLRSIIVTPDNLHQGLVEADVRDNEGREERHILLTSMPDQDNPYPRVITALPAGEARYIIDEGENWQTGIVTSEDSRQVVVVHEGVHATEIIGATSQYPARNGYLEHNEWAPQPDDVILALTPQPSK